MRSSYQLNERVTVHITHAIPPGLLGHITDGPRAIVRRREISWKPQDSDENGLAQNWLGETHEAVVIGFDVDRDQLELSIRYAEHNPWDAVADRYPVGRKVEGRVIGLIEDAAFVEVEPGLEAILPIGELPLSHDARIERWLWPEDHVKAAVESVDGDQHRMCLSMTRMLNQREAAYHRAIWGTGSTYTPPAVTIGEVLPGNVRLELLNWAQEMDDGAEEPQLRALVVEDDEVYATGLCSLLRCNGCTTEVARDGVGGLEILQRAGAPPDLVLVDWNLPGPKGHELLGAMRDQAAGSRIVVILEPAPLREMPHIRQKLLESGVDVIAKSNAQRCKLNLIALLREIRAVAPPPTGRRFPHLTELLATDSSDRPGSSLASATPPSRPATPATGLDQLVEAVRRDTGADTAVLLSIESGQPIPNVEASSGAPFPIETAPPDVIYSPLSDVLIKRQVVNDQGIEALSHYRRLTDLAPFEGFLGMPVPGVDATRYGLFLLKMAGAFGRAEVKVARLAAYLAGDAIQSRQLMQALTPWQGQNLAGQLVNSAIHELNNKLNGMGYQIEALERDINVLARWPRRAAEPTTMRQLVSQVERLTEAQRQISAITAHYLGLIANDVPASVDVAVVAENVLSLLKPEAQRHNITLELVKAADVPVVRAQARQLQQVFLNLLLNAIQQMAVIRRHGCITVDVAHDAHLKTVQVRIRDDGPGIHASLRERIFDFGFTTRRGGAGLGLTISREIVSKLRGTLSVEESHLLWGTTFLLELPTGAQHERHNPTAVGGR